MRPAWPALLCAPCARYALASGGPAAHASHAPKMTDARIRTPAHPGFAFGGSATSPSFRVGVGVVHGCAQPDETAHPRAAPFMHAHDPPRHQKARRCRRHSRTARGWTYFSPTDEGGEGWRNSARSAGALRHSGIRSARIRGGPGGWSAHWCVRRRSTRPVDTSAHPFTRRCAT